MSDAFWIEKKIKYKRKSSTYVLEAKLIVKEMLFSIGSKFAENKKEN